MEFMFRAVDNKELAPSCRIPYSVDMVRGAIQGDPEVKKIRNDINDEESARIPVLDDEQSRGMIVERSLALQERALPVSEERSLEERIYMNVEERFTASLEKIMAAALEKITAGALERITATTLENRMSMSIDRIIKISEMGEHSLGPFSQVRLEKIEEVVPSPNEAGKEDKQIDLMMELPDANRCGEKRKSVSPARQDANESTSENAKKKVKKAYTCDLCNVSATSQPGLDNHVRGKKHKLKVASSKLQNEEKDIDDDLLHLNKKAKGDTDVSGIEQKDVLPQEQAPSEFTKSVTVLVARGDADVSVIKVKDVLPHENASSEYTKSGTILHTEGDVDVSGIEQKDVLPQEQAASKYTQSGTVLLANGDVGVTGIKPKDVLPQEHVASGCTKSGTFLQAKGDVDVTGIKLKDVLPQEQAVSEYAKSGTFLQAKGDTDVSGIILKDVLPQEHGVIEYTISGTFLQAKGDADVSGIKLKGVLPQEPAASEHTKSSDPKKTAIGDWNCELCQVSMTSKKVFDTHMQGKKHKSKEAAALKLETEKKHLKESMPTNEAEEKSAGENDTSLLKGCDKIDTGDSNNTSEDDFKSSQHGKDGMLFWCKTCNVGTNSEVAMETHRKGKKHAQAVLKASSTNKISNNVVASDNLTKGREVDLVDNDTSEADVKSSRHGKKGMPFWCKTCNVGAYSEVVMETHWKGKKHAKEVRKAASTNNKISNNVVAGDDPMNGGVWDEDDVRSSV